MNDRQYCLDKLQTRFDEWLEQFDAYKARQEPYRHLKPADTKDRDLEGQLEAKQKVAKMRLAELRLADGGAWSDAEKTAEHALRELEELADRYFTWRT